MPEARPSHQFGRWSGPADQVEPCDRGLRWINHPMEKIMTSTNFQDLEISREIRISADWEQSDSQIWFSELPIRQ